MFLDIEKSAVMGSCGAGWTLLCVCVAVAEPIIGVSLDALRCMPALPSQRVPHMMEHRAAMQHLRTRPLE